MNHLKNLPEEPTALASLISIRPGRVISMSLSRNESCQMMLMAVSNGEEVTAEQYPGDTFYYVLEGTMPLFVDGVRKDMQTGEIAAVPEGKQHAIGGAGDFKILQVILMGNQNS